MKIKCQDGCVVVYDEKGHEVEFHPSESEELCITITSGKRFVDICFADDGKIFANGIKI